MTTKLDYETLMERRTASRMDRDCKAFDAMRRREDAADAMIGELCREGRIVHYVYPVGGKYREGQPSDLRRFLIRNGYA